VKKKLTHIPLINESQIAFGARLGINLVGCSLRVAGAHIEDCIRSKFYGENPLHATEKQIKLATKFGHDITAATRRVAHAVIADIMEQLDRETITTEGLAPGITVTNIHDKYPMRYVISSIQPDLLVYFKGGNGKKAFARSLKRVTETPNHCQ
jgi:hypothetical protein